MRNMSKQEKMVIQDRYNRESKNPSFSSTLLDEIYRSMDDGAEEKSGDLKFYGETIAKRHSRRMEKFCREMEKEEVVKSLPRPCLIEKWMEKQVSEKVASEGRQHFPELLRKSHNNFDNDHDLDQDGVLFSSTSLSSDSSFGGFSSSDSESIHTTSSFKVSCFAPPWLKPIRTCAHSRPEKPEKKQRALYNEHREFHLFDEYRSERDTEKNPDYNENMIKSKSRALKIYTQLKKVKDPISPGGRVASFLNSLFTAGTAKKTKNSSSTSTSTTCSSASSFSRSCLSNHSLSMRERARNVGDKRTVRFCPVSVIVDEDCKPCGHKSLWEENEPTLMAAPATVGRRSERLSRREEEKDRKPYGHKISWEENEGTLMAAPATVGKRSERLRRGEDEKELKFHVKEKTQSVKDAAKEILRDFNRHRDNYGEEEEEDDDDTESFSSSDLFELDHHAILELPVYETTRFNTNRVIASGLSM